MKKQALFLTVMLTLLIAACATTTPVSAQQDFNAYSGTTIDNSAIDGTIGSEWDDAGSYTNVAISPQGTADIWTKNDGTYLYMAVKFTADSNNPWVALLFGGTACMQSGADGALFGNDNYAANGYRDIFFNGYTEISVDASQDGTGAITIDSSNRVTVELKKPLNSGDSAGKDIAWTQDNTYSLIVMWNSKSYGASGGSVTHSYGSPIDQTIFINSNVIPEFPGLIFTAIFVATAISAILLKKRMTAKPVANVTS
jgi:hypothetical protein